jgi:hypothetical protein
MMKRLFLLLFLLFNVMVLIADPPGPPGPGGDPGGSGGVPVGSPIDGETIILLVVAVIYGIYKVLEFKHNKKTQELTK